MSGEGTRMVDRWLRRSEEREEKAISVGLGGEQSADEKGEEQAG